MNGAPDARKVATQWVEKAEHDLRNAEHTLTLVDDCPFDTICFHAHQCVEKYFKAGLTAFGTEFPRTHDLTELHVCCRQRSPPASTSLIWQSSARMRCERGIRDHGSPRRGKMRDEQSRLLKECARLCAAKCLPRF